MENTELRVQRARRRETQRDIAQVLNVEVTRYWAIENGHKEPTDEEVSALAAHFGVDKSVLFPHRASTSGSSAVQR